MKPPELLQSMVKSTEETSEYRTKNMQQHQLKMCNKKLSHLRRDALALQAKQAAKAAAKASGGGDQSTNGNKK